MKSSLQCADGQADLNARNNGRGNINKYNSLEHKDEFDIYNALEAGVEDLPLSP